MNLSDNLIKIKGKIVILLIVVFSLLGSSVNAFLIENIDNKMEKTNFEDLKITIYVDYVTNDYSLGLDELDWWPNTEPEWGYKVTIFDDSGNSNTIENWAGQSVYTWTVQESHEFIACESNAYTHLDIQLWDDDIPFDEQADISARNSDDQKSFRANYWLDTNQLAGMAGDQFENLGNGFYLLNGDLDGTGGHENDDNDAHMKIRITDNYEPMGVTLKVKEYMENNNVAPGVEITYKATITGGLGPFEYTLWPYGEYTPTTITKTSEGRFEEFKYTYKEGDHGQYIPYISIEDCQNMGSGNRTTVIVNKRPEKPTKPTMIRFLGAYYYKSTSSDIDNDDLQFKWRFNGIEGEWVFWNPSEKSSTVHKDKKYEKAEVKVRDDPDPLINVGFGYGLESDWSEPLKGDLVRTVYGINEFISHLLFRLQLFR